MASYKRAFLWFGGVHGDKVKGMELDVTAAQKKKHGRYYEPVCKTILALEYERRPARESARASKRALVTIPIETDLAHELVGGSERIVCKR